MTIKIVREQMPRGELRRMAKEYFGELVKAVVDVRRGIMAIGGDMHADEEAVLIEEGALQKDLWGVNLYPDQTGEGWLVFDSMINVRPSQGNRSRGVEDEAIQKEIRTIVAQLVAD